MEYLLIFDLLLFLYLQSMKYSTSTPNDISAIKQLLDAAFEQPQEGLLVEKLFKSKEFIPQLSIMVHDQEELIGYILFTQLPIKGSSHQSLALAPMAVSPNRQKQGVGSALIKYALEQAKQLGYTSVVVLGHAEYYPKFGFVPAASTWGITCPFPVPDEAFMALELQENALKGVRGEVIYAPAFSEM